MAQGDIDTQDGAQGWIGRIGALSGLDEPARAALLTRSRVLDLPRGTVIFGPGRTPENMLLLLDGCVRVQQTSEGGHEIVLYRIHAGESCVLTTACLLAQDAYTAEAVAETDISAAAIPRAVFDDLLGQSQAFRTFVFSAFSRRITDLFVMIDEVAFQRIDVRLAQKLLDLAGAGDGVATTHQKLAVELGTAREVVSRQLQEFQRRGWIEQARGALTLRDRAGLEALAQDRG
jgi:CRP/FNR family transcriptional regulator